MDNQITPQPNNPQPFFETLQQEMERAIDRFRFNPTVRDTALRMGLSGQMIPAVDVSETDDLFEITAEVPGVAKDDLDITINGDVVTLKGEKSSNREEKDKNYHLVERSYGHFQRSIPLGFTPDDDAVKAVFEDGVLTLSIHKPAAAKAAVRKVAINTD
jgi:HSP20 family protein